MDPLREALIKSGFSGEDIHFPTSINDVPIYNLRVPCKPRVIVVPRTTQLVSIPSSRCTSPRQHASQMRDIDALCARLRQLRRQKRTQSAFRVLRRANGNEVGTDERIPAIGGRLGRIRPAWNGWWRLDLLHVAPMGYRRWVEGKRRRTPSRESSGPR